MNIQDVLMALLSLFDVMSGAVLALSFGYLLFPSAMGFLVGGIGSLLTGNITPVSFQQEGLVLSRDLGKSLSERVSMILLAGLLTGLLGVLGLPQFIVNTIGPEIFFGLLAGVGLYLTRVGFDLAKEDWIIGLPCIIAALGMQLWTNNLVYAIAVSVPLGIIIKALRSRSAKKDQTAIVENETPVKMTYIQRLREDFRPIKLSFNGNILVGGLALATLTIGANIAYTGANLSMANQTTGPYNAVSIISGVADFASSLFGGASMEVIVSATAAAPHPIASGVLMMVGAAILLLSGLGQKLAKYVPISAMGGYLIAIGAILVLPYNAIDAFKAGNPIVVALTMGTTVATNPFYGMIIGVVSKLIMGWLGVL